MKFPGVMLRLIGVAAFALFANTVSGILFGMGLDRSCLPSAGSGGSGCGAVTWPLAAWIAAAVATAIIMLFSFNKYVIKLGNIEKVTRPPRAITLLQWVAIAWAVVALALTGLAVMADTTITFAPANAASGIGLMVLIAFFPGVTEELAYRWLVYDYAKRHLPRWGAVLVSGLLFGAIHFDQVNGIADASMLMVAGLAVTFLFASLYDWSGSLWAPITMHWIWDMTFIHVGIGVSSNHASHGALDPGLIDIARSQFLTIDFRFASRFLSGGDFGVDSSPLAILLFTVCATFFWNLRVRNERRIAVQAGRDSI